MFSLELPITRPIKEGFGDEINFKKLLENLTKEEFTGFIRVTHGSDEGYILFKKGYQVAASYSSDVREKALNKILEVSNDEKSFIEVFKLKNDQIDYLIDINKFYKLDKPVKYSESTSKKKLKKEKAEVKKEKAEKIKKSSVSREELLKKYRIKELNEEEVEKILGEFLPKKKKEEVKSNNINIKLDEIKPKLIQKIKKSVSNIPNIRDVNVLLTFENKPNFKGKIKIAAKYKRGLLLKLQDVKEEIKKLKEKIINTVEKILVDVFGSEKILKKVEIEVTIR